MNLFFRKKKYEGLGSLSSLAWKRFRKDKLSMISLFFVALSIVLSILGYLITPDSTPYANAQHLEIAARKPGFSVDMLNVKNTKKNKHKGFFSKMIFGEENNYTSYPVFAWHIKDNCIITEDYTGDIPNDGIKKSFKLSDVASPYENKIVENKTFWFGTDRYGRDVLSQLIIGARVSLAVGFISVFISLVIGILLGAMAGFFRGWVDNLIVWFINVVWSIPTLLLVIAITFALGKGFWQVFIAVGLTMWVEVARVVRGQILGIREKEFVEAGKALGYRSFRIIFRHILPNVMGPVIVISAANFASAILIEAGLSFLGIGVQPPMPSWGTMIKEHYAYIILDSAHLAILPGIAIMVMVLAFMLIGNGLRDALDVKAPRT